MDRREEEARAKRMRTIVSVAFTGVVCLCVFGVGLLFNGSPERAVAEGEQGDGAAEATQIESGFHEVTDTAGRTVKMPSVPTSIAIMDSFSGEAAVMIGAGPRVCGMPNGVRSDEILRAMFPAMDTDTVGTSGSAVNIETLMDAGCDAAIVKGSLDEAETSKLKRAGIPYAVVDYTTFDEQMDALRVVGDVCGGEARERAYALADVYEDTVDMVVERVTSIPDAQKSVVYHSVNSSLTTDGAGSLGADWIALAGCKGEYPSPTEGTDVTLTLDTVYRIDPDLIICGSYPATDEFLGEAKWAGLRAVRDGAVKTLPVGATRWGHRGDVETALGVVWLAKECYPEAMADIDLKALVQSIYSEYLGVTVDDALYETMLSGRGLRDVGTGNGNGNGGGNGGR